MKTLLFLASQSGFDLRQAPLGGPASISDAIVEGLQNRSDLNFRLLSSKILGSEAPRYEDFLRYSSKQWIDFIVKFERAVIAEVVRHDPHQTVILSNEDFRFRELSEKGYTVFCIHHMNLVDYLTNLFLRDLIRPVTTASLFRSINKSPFRFLMPEILKVTFLLQEESVLHVRGAIVPSEGLKRGLLEMYPGSRAEHIHVVPWGSHRQLYDGESVRARTEELRRRYSIPDGAAVLIALSRISPEKGQDRLLKALEIWEESADFPSRGLYVLLCGTAGYAQAKRFEARLVKFARRLKKAKVIFPGYVHGLDKQAHFALAELYVFPSRYESFGLTLMEAFQAGLPAVACYNYGTEQLLTPERGELLPAASENKIPWLLKEALRRMLSDPEKLSAMGRQAWAFAEMNPFSNTVDRLAQLTMDSV